MHIDDIMWEIDGIPGMDEFKALCHRLELAANNARGNMLGRIPLPNLVFAAAPGCGTTLHIRLLTELLKTLRLLPFTGEEECFEWSIPEDKKAFDRFLMRVKTAGGFYGQFRGVIGLDVSALMDGNDEFNIMERLMEYVDARQGKIMFVFIIPDDTPERLLRQLVGRFASISPVELIRMPFPAEEAKKYLSWQLETRGYQITAEAASLLEEAVQRLSTTDKFEGYQTLLSLTEEIIWHKVSRSAMTDTYITAEDLAFIFAEGGYYSQFSAYSQRRRVVGFGSSMEG